MIPCVPLALVLFVIAPLVLAGGSVLVLHAHGEGTPQKLPPRVQLDSLRPARHGGGDEHLDVLMRHPLIPLVSLPFK